MLHYEQIISDLRVEVQNFNCSKRNIKVTLKIVGSRCFIEIEGYIEQRRKS